MSAQRVKKGDKIVVKVGRDTGMEGVVKKVFRKDGLALVEGVNIVRKARKPTAEKPGEIESVEKPIQLSKIAVKCEKCGQSVRVKFVESGRVCRKCSAKID